jgi:hypothetical protein
VVEKALAALPGGIAKPGAALPSQKFGANAAWLRLNVILYNLLSAYKRVGLPEEFHTARPKRLRFLLLNTLGKVVRHARETLLRCTKEIARALAGAPRTLFSLKTAGPGCYDAVAIARAAGFPNAGYEPHPSYDRLSLNRSEPVKKERPKHPEKSRATSAKCRSVSRGC